MHNIRGPGSVENPIEPQDICNPQQVEDGDDSIKACVCTEDFCNGYMDKDEASQKPKQTTTTATTTTLSPRTKTTTQSFR